MKTPVFIITLLIALHTGIAPAANNTVDGLLQTYAAQGATTPDAERGKQLWQKQFAKRSCVSCHTQDLSTAGKHATTGKTIDAMAPSVNRERLTDTNKVEKWFLRNCKWTLGRECSAQEKADFLIYINQ